MGRPPSSVAAAPAHPRDAAGTIAGRLARVLAATAVLTLVPRGAGGATAPDAPASPAGALEFVMPAPGASIPSGPVIVAGRLPAEGAWVNLLLDGRPVPEVVREGRRFRATLAPAPGPHVVEALAADRSARLEFTYAARTRELPPYRYHTPVLEGRCAECHAGLRREIANAEAATCRSCHRKLAVVFPYVHGPVAAGKCLVCHEPHGSSRPALASADPKSLCTRCHDQPASQDHIEKARSRVCYLCHNPHASMNRRLLYDIVR